MARWISLGSLDALRTLGVDHAMIWLKSRDEDALRDIDELEGLVRSLDLAP
jgi:hypothetical protein